MIRRALVALVLLLTIAPAAHASSWTVDTEGWRLSLSDDPTNIMVDARLPYAIEGARLYFGRLPECPSGGLQIYGMTAVKVGPTDGSIIGWTQGTTTGQNCSIWIDRSYATFTDRSGLCEVIAHEVGHVLGFSHGPPSPYDPEGVMSPFAAMPSVCNRALPSDLARKHRKWCKNHKKTCRRVDPALASQVLKHQKD